MHRASCVILTVLLAACPTPTPLSSRFQIHQAEPDGVPVTRSFLLVGDNQFHHLYGDPFWMRSALTDKLVATAIRPVQLDLYGDALLGWMLARHGSRMPVIHLGDALDMACTVELEHFTQVMAAAKKGWFMAPGNHDAFFFGNFQERPPRQWNKACQRGGAPVNKALFVKKYLELLTAQNDPGARAFHDRLAARDDALPLDGTWTAEDHGGVLTGVTWHIDEGSPWRSYVIQRLNLTMPKSSRRVQAVILDTTDYANAPQLVPVPGTSFVNAGLSGYLSKPQRAVARSWLAAARERDELTVLIGHHPLHELDRKTREWVEGARAESDILVYVSAHTHRGRYYVHGAGGHSWLELNVGSILDWPPEYRTLSLAVDSKSKQVVMRTALHRLNEEAVSNLGDSPHCDTREGTWEAGPQDPDYFMTHASVSSGAHKTQLLLFNALLSSYKRLLRNVPTRSSPEWPADAHDDDALAARIDQVIGSSDAGEKAELLQALDRFERAREPVDPAVRRDYRICQALWASKYDHLGARNAGVDDWFISFPETEEE